MPTQGVSPSRGGQGAPRRLCWRKSAAGEELEAAEGHAGGKQEGSGQDALSDSSPCAREAGNSPRAGSAVPAERFLLCLPCALGCSQGGDRLRAPLVAP